MDVEEIMFDAEERMDKSVSVLLDSFSKVRSGKASPALLDGIRISLYGSDMDLRACANIMTPEARLIVIQPFDKNAIPPIEKAILTSDLGLNPVNDGTTIRVVIPTLTEERRRDLTKVIHRMSEEARQAIRQIRRDANDQLKKGKEAGDIPEDNMYRRQDEIQKLTDAHVKMVDDVLAKKEAEMMEV